MAAFYDLRYWKEFEQPDGSTIRLEIYSKSLQGISLTAYEIGPVVQALALTVQGQRDDIDTPIVKTSLTMTFVDAPDHPESFLKKCGDWEEFYTNDSTYWKVILKADGTTIWGGYITPDSFSEELRYRGSVTLVARDNIGHMQDFPFDAEGDENGLISLSELIEKAWAKIESPMELYLEDARQWMLCDGEMAYNTCMNVSAFKDMNWYEAVESALYSYGAVMRYIGGNEVMVCSLRYMPMHGKSSVDAVKHITPVFVAHAKRELVPAVRRIEETVDYDIEDYVFPKLPESEFTGRTESFLVMGNSVDYKGIAWTISSKESGMGWCCPENSMFFNPSAYSFYMQNGNDTDFNFLVCNTYGLEGNIGRRYAEYSRYCNVESMRLQLKFGQPYIFNINDELIPWGNVETVTVAIIVEHDGVDNYLQSDGTWGESAVAHVLTPENLVIDIPSFEFSGSLMMKVQIHHIKTTGAARSTPAYVPLYRAAFSVNSATLQKNTVNTKYEDNNNIILSRKPDFGPAYNMVSLPGFIKNGIYYYDGDVVKPAKAWSWRNDTPQQMAVYNHLQILCYHGKPNNIITGDIVNADITTAAVIYDWGGAEHMLISGTYNFLNGRIEGAVLREFTRYEDMWGYVSGSSMPEVEENGMTNQEGSQSSSGSSTGMLPGGSSTGGGSQGITNVTIDVGALKSYDGMTLSTRGMETAAGLTVAIAEKMLQGAYNKVIDNSDDYPAVWNYSAEKLTTNTLTLYFNKGDGSHTLDSCRLEYTYGGEWDVYFDSI